MELNERQKRLWLEIDINSIKNNFLLINGEICCVVKANAYGLGSVFLSKIYENLGAKYFAVSNIEEAIQLRQGGIKKPILVLGYTPVKCVKELYKYKIEQCIYSYDYAKRINDECLAKNIKVIGHLKIDTGMGRIGFQYTEFTKDLNSMIEACKMNKIIYKGIFTHFAISDEGLNDFTRKQFSLFNEVVMKLMENDIKFEIRHCANSAAIIDYSQYSLDMVRAGIILYGINPTNNKNFKYNRVASLKSIISNVKIIKKGDSVSYGRKFIADSDTRIATIPIGYADGFFRTNIGGRVYVNGEYCEIVGKVCMDQIMIKTEKGKVGDVVEIFGEHISIYEVSKRNNTIPYEILCSISERVPRVYIENNTIIEINDKIVEANNE